MADVANPTPPRFHNTMLTSDGWGTLYVKAERISHGMKVISSSSSSRFARALYVEARTSSSFSIDIVCTTEEEYAAVGAWIQGYGEKVSDPSGGSHPVRVICPSRGFDRIAVPVRVPFGANVKEVAYRMSIPFVGARDSVPDESNVTSTFVLPSSEDVSLPYYYPAGTQLSGSGKGDDTLYNYVASPTGGSMLNPSGPLASLADAMAAGNTSTIDPTQDFLNTVMPGSSAATKGE